MIRDRSTPPVFLVLPRRGSTVGTEGFPRFPVPSSGEQWYPSPPSTPLLSRDRPSRELSLLPLVGVTPSDHPTLLPPDPLPTLPLYAENPSFGPYCTN